MNNDPVLTHIKEALQQDPTSMPDYVSHEGLLLFKGRLVLSLSSVLIPILLTEFHDSNRPFGIY